MCEFLFVFFFFVSCFILSLNWGHNFLLFHAAWFSVMMFFLLLLSALRWRRLRNLCKLDVRDWWWEKLGLALVHKALLSKSLIQLFADVWSWLGVLSVFSLFDWLFYLFLSLLSVQLVEAWCSSQGLGLNLQGRWPEPQVLNTRELLIWLNISQWGFS